MTTIEAIERLLAAVREMSEIMRDQARIIEEQRALDEEDSRLLAVKRDHACGLIAEVSEEYADVY